MFEIETSNKPDSIKYDFKTTFPTAKVVITDNDGKSIYDKTVNLDQNGRAVVEVKTTANVSNLTAKVTNVEGNFEIVQSETTAMIGLAPVAANDAIDLNPNGAYALKVDDFGDGNNFAKVQFTSLLKEGLYLKEVEYSSFMNDKGEISRSEKDVFVELKSDEVVDISAIKAGKVVFQAGDGDKSSFSFKVGDGNGNFSNEYETSINIEKPTNILSGEGFDLRNVNINKNDDGSGDIYLNLNSNKSDKLNISLDDVLNSGYKSINIFSDKDDISITNRDGWKINPETSETGVSQHWEKVDEPSVDIYITSNSDSSLTIKVEDPNLTQQI